MNTLEDVLALSFRNISSNARQAVTGNQLSPVVALAACSLSKDMQDSILSKLIDLTVEDSILLIKERRCL